MTQNNETSVGNRRAIAAAVAAGGFFAIMDSLVKLLTADYPVMQVVFLRAAASLILVLAALPWFGGVAALRMTGFFAQLLRAVYGVAATACFFYAFRHLPLADVYVVGHAAPFFVTVLSVVLLRETVGTRRWAAVIIGFIGVVVVLQPWDGVVATANGPAAGAATTARDWAPWVAAVGAAYFYALTVVKIRALSGGASAIGMVALFLTCAMLAGAVFGLPVWTPLTWTDAGLVALMGIFGVGGQLFMTLSYRLGPAGLVAPFEYAGLIWATALGFLLFGHVPTPAVMIGGAVIVAGGLYLFHHEAG